jgi:hypothetical protein
MKLLNSLIAIVFLATTVKAEVDSLTILSGK